MANTRQGAHTPPRGILAVILLTDVYLLSGGAPTKPLIHCLLAQPREYKKH